MALSKSLLNKYSDKVKLTKKALYGKYKYKVVIQTPMAHVVRALRYNHYTSWNDPDAVRQSYNVLLKDALRRHKEFPLSRRWKNEYAMMLDFDYTVLYKFHEVWDQHKDDLRLRIEGYKLSYCTNNEKVVEKLASIAKFKHLLELHCPKDAEAERKLLLDKTVFKKNPTHKFLVTATSRRYTIDEIKRINEYVKNAGYNVTDIKFPELFSQRMDGCGYTHSGPYLYGQYYVNDESIIMMLKLLCPEFVKTINPIEAI